MGNWRIERQPDRITGEALSSAILMTANSSNSTEAYAQPAQLQLLCFKDQPLIRFTFEFKVGWNRNSAFGYRFDEKPGHEIEARFLQDFKTAVIEKKDDVAQFVSELATSGVLYVRIRSLNAGRSTAEFRLNGAPAAIDAAFARCPATADPKSRPASAPATRRVAA